MNALLRRPASHRLLAVALAFLAGPLAAADTALPAPRGDEAVANRILADRHDTTAFLATGLPQQAVSDLLWSSTGINRPATGGRTSNYSYTSRDNEIYLLCAQGVFLYDQLEHQLTKKSTTDLRSTLGAPADTAPLTLVIATYSSSVDFFGSIHSGFISENIAFTCADRGLGAHVSATIPTGLASALGLASSRTILLLDSIGYPAGTTVTAPAWPVTSGALVAAAVNDAPALQILKRRRSTRNFASTTFSTQTLADLVWAGMGVNNTATDERTSPLIAGVNDIDLYVVMSTGAYRYRPGAGATHTLEQVTTTDLRSTISSDSGSVPAIFIYVVDNAKLSGTSAQKQRQACLHAGHISQNVAAYAAAEGLGELVRSSVTNVSSALGLAANQSILFTQTLGYLSGAPGKSTVTIGAGTGGSVTGTTSQSIAFGANGTAVTAVPAAGNTFAYWSGLPGGRVTTNPLALVNVTSEMTVSAVFAPIPASYPDWRSANFTGADLADDTLSGPLADPDSSGLTNLERYAFDLAARGPVAAPVTVTTAESGDQRYLKIEFPRRTVGSDVQYVVQTSTDLVNWTTHETVQIGATTPYTVTYPTPIATDQPRRFLRVRVEAIVSLEDAPQHGR
jgi:hypothetical protein